MGLFHKYFASILGCDKKYRCFPNLKRPPTFLSVTKIQTTNRIITKLDTRKNSVNTTSHSEFQVDISVSEELATLR